jgi:hypothetical protein
MVSLVLKSFWLIAADPHRGRVHFITTKQTAIDKKQGHETILVYRSHRMVYPVREIVHPLDSLTGGASYAYYV